MQIMLSIYQCMLSAVLYCVGYLRRSLLPFVVHSPASWCLSDDEDPIQGWHTPRVDVLGSLIDIDEIFRYLHRKPRVLFALFVMESMCWPQFTLSVMVAPRYLADVTAVSNCPRMVYCHDGVLLAGDGEDCTFCWMELHAPVFSPLCEFVEVFLEVFCIILRCHSEVGDSVVRK